MRNDPEDYKIKSDTLDSFYRGIVEDNNDPEKLGRVRVRVIGIHTDQKIQDNISGVPTSHLPWATPIMPVNGGGSSGIGSFSIPILGSQVFIFYENGNILQPRYFGVAPGQPFNSPAGSKLTAPGTWPTDVEPIPDEILENATIEVTINRFEHDSNKGTKGNVITKTKPTDGGKAKVLKKCVSLELPWLNNQNNYSCIPKGTYYCTYTRSSNSFIGQSYILSGVSGRYGVRIHRGWYAGNEKVPGYVSDVEGCIIFGDSFTEAVPSRGKYSQYKILNGTSIQANFDGMLRGEPFVLKITGVVG